MFAERQARYPKGTYKIVYSRLDGRMEFCLVNLCTGWHAHSSSMWELVKSIESDMSANKFPQCTIQYRSWAAPAQSDAKTVRACKIEGKAGEQGEPRGSTFILSVLYQQNATWQGTVRWMEGRQSRPYRSVNELLRLMDEAAECPPTEAE